MQITRDLLKDAIARAEQPLSEDERTRLHEWAESATRFNCSYNCPLVQTGLVNWTDIVDDHYWEFMFSFDHQIVGRQPARLIDVSIEVVG